MNKRKTEIEMVRDLLLENKGGLRDNKEIILKGIAGDITWLLTRLEEAKTAMMEVHESSRKEWTPVAQIVEEVEHIARHWLEGSD